MSKQRGAYAAECNEFLFCFLVIFFLFNLLILYFPSLCHLLITVFYVVVCWLSKTKGRLQYKERLVEHHKTCSPHAPLYKLVQLLCPQDISNRLSAMRANCKNYKNFRGLKIQVLTAKVTYKYTNKFIIIVQLFLQCY